MIPARCLQRASDRDGCLLYRRQVRQGRAHVKSVPQPGERLLRQPLLLAPADMPTSAAGISEPEQGLVAPNV